MREGASSSLQVPNTMSDLVLTHVAVSDTEGWSINIADAKRRWMDNTPNGFAYRCIPMTVANGLGLVITCPFTFAATWDGRSMHFRFSEDAPVNANAIVSNHFGQNILTFQLPYLFRTDIEGIGCYFRGLPNYWKDGIHPLEGYVETWWLPFTATMNWAFTRPDTVLFAKGDPVCFVHPALNAHRMLNNLTVQSSTLDKQEPEFIKEYEEWKTRRRRYNADPLRDGKRGEGCYVRAEGVEKHVKSPKGIKLDEDQKPSDGV